MPDFAVSAAIKANGAQFINTFSTLQSRIMGFASSTESAFSRASRGAGLFNKLVSANIVGNLATSAIRRVGAELRSLPEAMTSFVDKAQEIGRTAEKLGLTAAAFQRVSYVASQTDTPVDTLTSAMQRLNKNMADYTVGKGSFRDLAKYGPVGLAKQIRGTHDATEAMLIMADAVANTKDAQVRAAMTQAAFGKGGQELIPLLARGRTELEKMFKAYDKYGGYTQSAIDACDKFDNSQKALRLTMDSLRIQTLSKLLPVVQPYVDKLTTWIDKNKDLIATRIETVLDKTIGFLEKGVPVIEKWGPAVLKVVAGWEALKLAINGAKTAQIAYNLIANKMPIPSAIPSVPSMAKPVVETAIGAGAGKWAGRFAGGAAGTAITGGLGATLGTVGAIGAPILLGAAMPIIDPGRFKNAVADTMASIPKAATSMSKNIGYHPLDFLKSSLNVLKAIPGLAMGKVPASWGQSEVSPGRLDPMIANPSAQKVDVNVFLKWLSDNRGVQAAVALTGDPGHQYGVER